MTNTKKLKKVLVSLALFSIFLFNASAQVFFDSEGGVGLDTIPKAGFEGIDLNVRAYYGAQIQLGNNLLIESEFSFFTDSIIDKIFLQDVPANFSLDKLSFSYNIAGLNFNSRVSAFAGTQDVFGTDDFAKKYFGARSFDSILLEKRIGYDQPGIYSIDGFGLELNTVYNTSVATAFYAYYNEGFGKKQLNFDSRIVGIANAVIADFSFGVSLPFDDSNSSGDALLVIKRADLHSGLTLLIGNNPYANLYLQAGVTRIQINPDVGEKVFSLENLHVLLEPRFAVGNARTSLAFFIMPQSTVDLIDYIEYSSGASYSLDLTSNLGVVKLNYGAHISASYNDINGLIENPVFNIDDLSVVGTPYVTFAVGSGSFNVSAPISVLRFTEPDKMFKIAVSYKASF